MPGISIHVVDVSRGLVAAGMRVQLRRGADGIVDAVTSGKGLVEVEGRVPAATYEAVFHVAQWYRAQQVPLPAVPFLDVVTYFRGGA